LLPVVGIRTAAEGLRRGAATVVADRLEPLEVSELLAVRSRDFQ